MRSSQLSSSGFTNTNPIIYNWCEHHVGIIRNQFGDNLSNLSANLWSYRYDGFEAFSFDIFQGKQFYTMTLMATGSLDKNLDNSDYDVVDLSEALHIVGIIAEALKLQVKIGRRENETNRSLLSEPLTGNQTNGRLKTV